MNSKMLFYILKRVLLALLTIWIVITVTFFVMHSIPGLSLIHISEPTRPY